MIIDNNPEEIVNAFISEQIKMRREVISREIMTFFRDHRGCEKFFCTTCGGRSHLAKNLDYYLEKKGISRISALCEIVPEELVHVKDWEECLTFALGNMPKQLLETVIIDRWIRLWGRSPEFDHYLVETIIPRLGTITSKGQQWAVRLLLGPITESKVKIRNLLSETEDPEIIALIHLFDEIYNNHLETQRRIKSVDFEKWKKQYPGKYEEMIAEIEREKYRSEIRRKNYQEAERIRQAEKLQKENQQKELHEIRIRDLAELAPLDRLNVIIEDNALSLWSVPAEWSDIDAEQFFHLSSTTITTLIRKLTEKMNDEDQKSIENWRDLRSRLYLIRQSVMKNEFTGRFSNTKENV